MKTFTKGIFAAMVLLAFAGSTTAQIVLQDQNSTVTVDPNLNPGAIAPFSSIMPSWSVDGVQQLYDLDFYYRIGAVGPESQLKTIAPLAGVFASDTNPFTDPSNDVVSMLYSTPGFVDVELKISLLGGSAGSGWSDVAQQIKITNTGAAPLDFHLFEYADFDLGGTAFDDTGTLLTPFDEVYMTDGSTVFTMDSIVVPDAIHGDITVFPSLINLMNDPLATTLSDNTGPVTGDVEYGLQWDVVLDPGSTFILSKDMLISPIPEPGAVTLIALSAASFVFIRRRFIT
jgi:hypothetical protein